MAEDNEKSGLHKVLSAADKGVLEPRGSAGLLAKAWRIILFKLRMDPARLNVAMRAYSRMLEERGIILDRKAVFQIVIWPVPFMTGRVGAIALGKRAGAHLRSGRRSGRTR